MLDVLLLIGSALAFGGVLAMADPCLMGWRSRKDAAVMLAIGVALLGAGWFTRF